MQPTVTLPVCCTSWTFKLTLCTWLWLRSQALAKLVGLNSLATSNLSAFLIQSLHWSNTPDLMSACFLLMPKSCWNTKGQEASLKLSTPCGRVNSYENDGSVLVYTVNLLLVGCLAVAVAHPRPSSRRKTYQRVLTSMSYSNMLRQHWAVET